MRDVFHTRLNRLRGELQALCLQATVAMTNATSALLNADLYLSEQVIGDDLAVVRAHGEFKRAANTFLTSWAPVTGDLRTTFAMITVGEKARLMAALARHIAEAGRRHHPHPVVPTPLTRRFEEMSQIGVFIGRQVHAAVGNAALININELERLEDRVDEVETLILAWVSRRKTDTEAVVNTTLMARYFERYADQAFGAARTLYFVRPYARSRRASHRYITIPR